MNDKTMTIADLYREARAMLGAGISLCIEITVWDHVYSGVDATWNIYAAQTPSHAIGGESNESMRAEGKTPEQTLEAFRALFASMPAVPSDALKLASESAAELPL